MADLARHAVHAAIELAVQYQSAADARGQLGVDQVVVSAARAQLVLGQRRQVAVVVHVNRQVQPFGQHVAHRLVVQGHDVAGLHAHALFIVDVGGEGRAHAPDILEGQPRGGHQLAHLVGQQVHQFLRADLLVRQEVLFRHDFAFVEQPQLDAGAADVDADHVFFHAQASFEFESVYFS